MASLVWPGTLRLSTSRGLAWLVCLASELRRVSCLSGGGRSMRSTTWYAWVAAAGHRPQPAASYAPAAPTLFVSALHSCSGRRTRRRRWPTSPISWRRSWRCRGGLAFRRTACQCAQCHERWRRLRELYWAERSRVSGPIGTCDHCRVGLLDANVIIAALEQQGLHCSWLDNRKFSGTFRRAPAALCCAPPTQLLIEQRSSVMFPGVDGTRIRVDRLVGVIVNRAGFFGLHWFAIRRLGDRIYCLDSKLSRPRQYASVDEVGTAAPNVTCDERCPPHSGARVVAFLACLSGYSCTVNCGIW